jgi:gluconate 2-dehydrogenase subunit 3-like protein
MKPKERYPGADILAQRGHWDPATRRVVLDRVRNVPAFHYFDTAARATLEALCARVIPQDHRPPGRRVPIAPWIDQRCAQHIISGFRFDNMPPDEVAWEWGLRGLDETAHALHGRTFVDLDAAEQDAVLQAIRAGNPPGAVWQQLPAQRWWVYVVLRQISGIYYAHPYAWDEIGFGGPAYPRGYFALNNGAPEPWEPREVAE